MEEVELIKIVVDLTIVWRRLRQERRRTQRRSSANAASGSKRGTHERRLLVLGL